MAKKTKVENTTIKDAMTAVPATEVEFNGMKFSIKDHLSYSEMMAFVSTVVSACFNKESGEYRPHIKDFVSKVCAITLYTDITLPDSVEDKYEVVYGTNIPFLIEDHCNHHQYFSILDSIDSVLENEVRVNTDHVMKGLEDMYQAMNGLMTQLKGTFDGVTQEDITALTKALSSGVIDENKIAQAYVNAKKQ